MNVLKEIQKLIASDAGDEDVRMMMRRVIDDPKSKTEDIMSLLSPFLVRKYITAELFLLSVEKIVQNISDINRAAEIADGFGAYYRNHPDESIELVIALLANDNGYVRHVGRHIWDRYDISKRVHHEDLSLDMQMRVGVSLLQDFMNPESHLSFVIPMVNSQDPDLRRIIFELVQLYAINYEGIFRRVLERTPLEENEEVKRLRSLLDNTNEHFKYVNLCKEFWSEYAYPAELEIANRMVSGHMSALAKKAEEDSKDNFFFTKMLKNVLLGRGGGMRMPNGQVHPLQKIEYSAQLPLYLAAFSPKEENDWNNMIFADWSKIKGNE